MATKTQKPPTIQTLATLIQTMRTDSVTQFGEIKKEFGAMNKIVEGHDADLKALKTDKTERDAIARYLRDHPEAAKAAKDEDNGKKINPELIKVILQLVTVIGILAAVIIGLRFTNK